MDNQKKISLAEALLMILLNLFGDAIDAALNFLALVPVIGIGILMISPFVSASFFAITEFWLIMRGGVGFRQQVSVIVGNLLDIIPFLSFLPFKTVSVAVAIYMVNHPKAITALSAGTSNLVSKAVPAAATTE
ncbi:hypothetical protein A3J77_01770 [Candidatus Wolfebacteria bacterium RBG_13_41_7]|uniref:Uncharacterized protein n=1 Tax=Candidatus Wolfebacteria bacterium RBG_13_41_7 TaxID=1802554 RepID=A0A1F8DPF9_9BACT|nr:MAG: hypothetical protein A3J77_01770 [Candidatus Wolfebacteria bacterium RBG_13_41_7]